MPQLHKLSLLKVRYINYIIYCEQANPNANPTIAFSVKEDKRL